MSGFAISGAGRASVPINSHYIRVCYAQVTLNVGRVSALRFDVNKLVILLGKYTTALPLASKNDSQ